MRKADATPTTPDRHLRAHQALAQVSEQVQPDALYLGRDWRIRVVGDDLVHERLIAGVWTVKDTIAGA